MNNLLRDPLIRIETATGIERVSLPGVFAALAADRVESFPALRAHQAPHSLHMLLPVSPSSVSVLLSDLAIGLRTDCVEMIADGKEFVESFRAHAGLPRLSLVAGRSDDDSAKRSKHKRRCRLWMDDERVALVDTDRTCRILKPVVSTPCYRLSVPLPSFGSGACQSLPRAREDLIAVYLPSGAQTV